MAANHPIISNVPGVDSSVRFVKHGALESLPVPWPRSQDIEACSVAKPQKDDFVVAVSHAWPYQAHPDPLGQKAAALQELLASARAVHKPKGKTLLFLDFISTPQRPFRQGQAPRTPEEDAAFAVALKAFPLIYLMADVTLHLDVELSAVPGDGEIFEAELADLTLAKLQLVGAAVQVTDVKEGVEAVAPFDVVTKIGGTSIKSLADVQRARDSQTPTLTSWFCCADDSASMTMQRAPFGRRNVLAADVKGWIFLERFVSMVKAAMVPESQAKGVTFSNSQAILDQIFAGGARLRKAAVAGKAALALELQRFAKELDSKKFSATSMDKLQNTGGIGGLNSTAYSASERDVVWVLMQELVMHLEDRWECEALAQQQRQLVLAVSRGDAAAVRTLLQEKVDPNIPDSKGVTCLHDAAIYRNVEVARLLVEHGADTMKADQHKSLPIHKLSYLSDDAFVDLFDLLAPTRNELAAANAAGVTPLKRYAVWVGVELHAKPFLPAQRHFEHLRKEHGDVLAAQSPGNMRPSNLSPQRASKGLERFRVDGRSVPIHIWEPGDRVPVKVHIVWASLNWMIPWSLLEPAMELLAQCICAKFQAKLWVLTTGALNLKFMEAGEPLAKLQEDLLAVVKVLPLPDKFFWVDGNQGSTTGMIWLLKDRLLGAMVLNSGPYFNDEFEGSQVHQRVSQFYGSFQAIAESRDVDKLVDLMPDFVYVSNVLQLEHLQQVYKAALETAPHDAWAWWAYIFKDVMHVHRVYEQWTTEPLCVLIVVSAFAPTLFMHQAALQLNSKLPNATITYIPECRGHWEIDDEGPPCEDFKVAKVYRVAALLSQLLQDKLPQ